MNSNTKDVTARSVEDCFMVLHGAPLKNVSSTFHCDFNMKQCYSTIEWSYLKGNTFIFHVFQRSLGILPFTLFIQTNQIQKTLL